MKRAFLVVGAENSGTRLMTRLLIKAGCHGSAEHYQLFDDHPFRGESIVFRRSYPHGSSWPSLLELKYRLQREGYMSIYVIVMVRSWRATAASQVRVGHSKNFDQAYEKIRDAYAVIFTELAASRLPFIVVNYNALCTLPEKELTWITDMLRLPAIRSPEALVLQDHKY